MTQKTNHLSMTIIKIITNLFLFSCYPILLLVVLNIDVFEISIAKRSLVFSILFFAMIFLLIYILTKSLIKSNLVTAFLVIVFYFFGHLFNILSKYIFNLSLPSYIVVSLLIVATTIFYILFHYKEHIIHVNMLVIISLVLYLQIGIYYVNSEQLTFNIQTTIQNDFLILNENSEEFPDIYYIILDAYTRDDVLLDEFNFDNTEFLKSLEDVGFYIAGCSQSNYAHTKYSLGSSLNLDYIESFFSKKEFGLIRESNIFDILVENNVVFDLIKSVGYKTVAFETTYPFSEFTTADYYLSFSSNSKNISKKVNQLEYLLLRNSFLISTLLLPKEVSGIVIPSFDKTTEWHRKVMAYSLDSLSTTVHNIPGPKFVFTHILSPHEPHTYGPNGEVLSDPPPFKLGYTYQVDYINEQILQAIDAILENSKKSPIIILQGDHGPQKEVAPEDQIAILNAYFGPDAFIETLYPSISPVNSFRKLFNYQFDTDFQILDDISYFSNYDQNYAIMDKQKLGCEYDD
jgi:hypothetical protein